jgi:outer membrane immunogenic protein
MKSASVSVGISMISLSANNRWHDLARAAVAFAVLIAAVGLGRARAADLDDSYLRGSYTSFERAPVRWDGVYLGGDASYSNLSTYFDKSQGSLSAYSITLPNSTTNSVSYGGFLGYNWQVDPELVLGLEFAYTRPSSFESTVTASGGGATSTASYRLVDWGTFRARAGYAFGQFLPYVVLGAAVGRVDYSISAATNAGASILQESRDNSYTIGALGGLGIDVAVLPNVFVRAEWEYIYFSGVKSITSSINTARVGLGIRF